MADRDENAPSDQGGSVPLPEVTIETGAGAATLTFGYQAQADVAYSDVPKASRWFATEAAAESYGAWIISLGNWRSFTIEKRYFGRADG